MTTKNTHGIAQRGAALVTGAARRIGAAICRDLAAAGFAVAIHYRNSAHEAAALVAEIADPGGRAIALQADLTDEAQCRGLMAAAAERLGPVQLLVNNASLFQPDLADEFNRLLWDRHFAMHLRAPVILTAEMARQTDLVSGMVVNMVDQRVWSLDPSFFSYTLSKSALWTATRTMAQHYAPRIRVNAIGPGPTLPNEWQSEDDFARQELSLPLRRGPALADFARTILYLYETGSITGQMIALDGGQHLAWDKARAAERGRLKSKE